MKTRYGLLMVAGMVAGCAAQPPAPVVGGLSKSGMTPLDIPAQQASNTGHGQGVNLKDIEPAAGPVDGQAAPQTVRSYTVTGRDTVYSIADHYDVKPAAILAYNDMPSETSLRVGQELKIPASQTHSMPVAPQVKEVNLPANTAAPAATAAVKPTKAEVQISKAGVAKPTYVEHKVLPKETIYKISLQYHASVFDIMAANDFDRPQDLLAGSIIKVPVTSGVAANSKTEEEVESAAIVKKEKNAPTKMVLTHADDVNKHLARAVNSANQLDLDAEKLRGQIDKAANQSKGLVWPVKGKIVRRFGEDSQGVEHTGINIAVPTGTRVLASDDGVVLYADDGLKMYGKLVLLRHSNGMVSAYAHNSRLLVKKGEHVKKGQVIAMSGASGNVATPQLHFELRRHASAIDPLRVLPKL